MKHFPALSANNNWKFHTVTPVADVYRYTKSDIPHTIELLVVEWRPQDYIIRLQSDACSNPVEQTETVHREIAVAEATRFMDKTESLLSKKKTTKFVTDTHQRV